MIGGRDQQNLTDTRQHQGTERIINHRFIVNWQQLFTDRLGDRMQASATATGQNNAAALGW
jgi:hypothetical protein